MVKIIISFNDIILNTLGMYTQNGLFKAKEIRRSKFSFLYFYIVMHITYNVIISLCATIKYACVVHKKLLTKKVLF